MNKPSTPTTDDPLLSGVTLGAWACRNRVLMAPLTRSRSTQPGDVPGPVNAIYYRQRASAGLIISEATQISPRAKGYAFTPGIYTVAQRDGWRLITDAVHDAGGLIIAQLWHVGRISHTALQPGNAAPLAPSALRAEGSKTYIDSSMARVDVSQPRALETNEIADVMREYAHAARVARDAGFDGVQLHGANGYLVDEFLRTGSNRRTDGYGGSLANRLRFALEAVDALVAVWPAERVSVRISPGNHGPTMQDDDPVETFGALAERLNAYGLGFLEIRESYRPPGSTSHPAELPREKAPDEVCRAVRRHCTGWVVVNGGYTLAAAREAITSGYADAVAFGRAFISNPDLPERIRDGLALANPDPETYYGGGEAGYTDYPRAGA